MLDPRAISSCRGGPPAIPRAQCQCRHQFCHRQVNGRPDVLETELFSVCQSKMAEIEFLEGVAFAEGTVPGFKGCPPYLNWYTLLNPPSDEEFNTQYSPPPLGPKMRALFRERKRKLAEVSPDEETPQSDKAPEPPSVWHIWHKALIRLRQT